MFRSFDSTVKTYNLRAKHFPDVISVRLGASKHFRCIAMDSNKDEAERCIKIALNAIGNDQTDKARKFLEKAQRLFPTDRAKSRLRRVHFCFLGGFLCLTVGHGCETESANVSITVLSLHQQLLASTGTCSLFRPIVAISRLCLVTYCL